MRKDGYIIDNFSIAKDNLREKPAEKKSGGLSKDNILQKFNETMRIVDSDEWRNGDVLHQRRNSANDK